MANFETIKLDKGLYNTRKGFLNELESIDPSENYKGTSLEGLDAFERQLKRFDIKVKGAAESVVAKNLSIVSLFAPLTLMSKRFNCLSNASRPSSDVPL